jgi:hypothetical protein
MRIEEQPQPPSRDEAARALRETMVRLNRAAHDDPLALRSVATNLEHQKRKLSFR